MTDCKKKYRNQFVKAAYLSMAISLVLTTGCTTVGDKRYVENNTFISTYPKMAIKVRPELKYVGEYHGDIFKRVTWDMDMRDHKHERTLYIFCEKGSEGNVKRGIFIYTIKLPEGAHWVSGPFTSEKSKRGKLDTGETEFGGMKWPYAIWSTGNFFGFAKDFVHDAGYSTTNQHLVFAFGRIITHEQDTIMLLYYIEDLRECRPDMQRLPLKPPKDEEGFVHLFMSRAFKAVQFLKDETPPEKALSESTPPERTSEEPTIPTQEKRMAYIPDEFKDGRIPTIKLRSTPKQLWDSDIEKMLGKYNFFVKRMNEVGHFPNYFVDNVDGTVTDRVTGLMWEKGGSPSAMRYWSAKRYVSRLNKERSRGYNDWRIPTTEELASLLERNPNKRGLYLAPLLDGKPKAYWTSDPVPTAHTWATQNSVVDFSNASIDSANSASGHNTLGWEEDQCFIRAVRSIK